MLEKSIALINPVYHFIKNNLCSKLFPFTCVVCRKLSDRRQDLCQACLQDLPIIEQSCPRCANKITSIFSLQKEALLCGNCLSDPPPFQRTNALFVYEAPVISFILNLKFKQQLVYARILGELMAEKIRHSGELSVTCILPVPLHEKRLRERGFNQALELARPIAAAFNLKIDTDRVKRVQNTAPQMSLPAKKRETNLKHAFSTQYSFTGERIAILDDVMTTGATVSELSRVLLEKNAAHIEIWCIARAAFTFG